MTTAPTTECASCADSRAATYPTADTAGHAAALMAELIGADLWRAKECPAGNWHVFQMEPEARDWQPTRWWRVVGPTGEIWCESSDEDEVRSMARPDDRVERLFSRTEQRWGQP